MQGAPSWGAWRAVKARPANINSSEHPGLRFAVYPTRVKSLHLTGCARSRAQAYPRWRVRGRIPGDGLSRNGPEVGEVVRVRGPVGRRGTTCGGAGTY